MQCAACGNRWTLAYCGDHTTRPKPGSPTPSARRAEPQTLDLVYRALLGALPLIPEHRRALRGRGLPDADIGRRLYRSLPQRGRARLACALVDQFGADTCAQVPGLYVKRDGSREYWTLAGAIGLLIPVRDVQGRIVALKIRADDDMTQRYTIASSKAYGGPSPGAPVHVPLHTVADTSTTRVTEGELKADVTTAMTELLSISIPGVAMWRSVIPVLEELGATAVRLAFDADWRSNQHVAKALGALTHALLKAGIDVTAEGWDAALGKGLDDLLVAGHLPTQRSAAWALGASMRGQAKGYTGTLRTVDARGVKPWH